WPLQGSRPEPEIPPQSAAAPLAGRDRRSTTTRPPGCFAPEARSFVGADSVRGQGRVQRKKTRSIPLRTAEEVGDGRGAAVRWGGVVRRRPEPANPHPPVILAQPHRGVAAVVAGAVPRHPA